MAIRHEFRMGNATVFVEEGLSVLHDSFKDSASQRSVLIFVKHPGTMFVAGQLGTVQKRVKKAAEKVYGVSSGVVNLQKITLYDRSIRTFQDGIDVVTEFLEEFNAQYDKVMEALEGTT